MHAEGRLMKAFLHSPYTDKYILYLYIAAAGPVAREKQWMTMSRHVIVRVLSASGQALKRYEETTLDVRNMRKSERA